MIVEIVSRGRRGEIAVGLVAKDFDTDHFPGWDSASWGYHADNGRYVILCNVQRINTSLQKK